MRRTHKLPRILFLLIGCYGALLSLLLALWILLGEKTAPLILLVNAMPLVLLPAPILLLPALIGRRWIITVTLLLPVSLLLWFYLPLFLPRPLATDSPQSFTVMSYNLRWTNSDTVAIAALLRESDADIVALVEVDGSVYQHIDRELRDFYPHQIAMPPSGGGSWQMILSKFPIIGAPINRVLYATLLIHDQSVRVYAVHLPRPSSNILSLNPRYHILNWVLSLAVEDGTPAIMMGDFNMSDRSEAYSILTTNFDDVWRTAGNGLGMTYPNWSTLLPQVAFLPALLRPDYIFVDSRIGIVEAQVMTQGNSDHFPIRARLTLPER